MNDVDHGNSELIKLLFDMLMSEENQSKLRNLLIEKIESQPSGSTQDNQLLDNRLLDNEFLKSLKRLASAPAAEAAQNAVDLEDSIKTIKAALCQEVFGRGPQLESMLQGSEQVKDLSLWFSNVSKLWRSICRVDIAENTPSGTGFLISQQTVLTCYHVIYKNGQRNAPHCEPKDIQLIFDFYEGSSGSKKYHLSKEKWCLAQDATLDYIVLQLNQPLSSRTPFQKAKRLLDKNHILKIFQHPDGKSSKVGYGFLKESWSDGYTHLHSVNTSKGSSGSPVLNSDLDVVGVHRFGEVAATKSTGKFNGFHDIHKIIEHSRRFGVDFDSTLNPRQIQTVTPTPTTGKRQRQRYPLTIELIKQEQIITRKYHYPDGSTQECLYPHELNEDLLRAQILFPLLFPTGPNNSHSNNVLSYLTGQETTPPSVSVRVKIESNDNQLLMLPWTQTSFNGRLLREENWTFETQRRGGGQDNVTLEAPSLVYIFSGSLSEHLSHNALRDFLKDTLGNAWPKSKSVLEFQTKSDLWSAIDKCTPAVLIYSGHMTVDNDGVVKLETQSQSEKIALRDLLTWSVSKALILSLSSNIPSAFAATLAQHEGTLPFLLAFQQDEEAPKALRRWAQQVLVDGHDPVSAANSEFKKAHIWSNYKEWLYKTTRPSTKSQTSLWILNRQSQRKEAHRPVLNLARSPKQKVLCMIALAEQGNSLNEFHNTLLIDFREWLSENIRIDRRSINLKFVNGMTVDTVKNKLLEKLSKKPRDTVRTILSNNFERRGEKPPVLLLNWGVVDDNDPLSENLIKAWLSFCLDELTPNCPDDLDIICYLGISRDSSVHEDIQKTVKRLKQRQKFEQDSLKIVLLPPLGRVSEADIFGFLKSGQSDCYSDNNVFIRKLAKHIYTKTQGQFERTVELLDSKPWINFKPESVILDEAESEYEDNQGDKPL